MTFYSLLDFQMFTFLLAKNSETTTNSLFFGKNHLLFGKSHLLFGKNTRKNVFTSEM